MFIYNLVIALYGFVIRIASINKTKAKQWVQGRKNWRQNYSNKLAALHLNKNDSQKQLCDFFTTHITDVATLKRITQPNTLLGILIDYSASSTTATSCMRSLVNKRIEALIAKLRSDQCQQLEHTELTGRIAIVRGEVKARSSFFPNKTPPKQPTEAAKPGVTSPSI